ncbi:MAG: flavin reductase family protein [Thermodesulforhabdaceae bacterium]
MILEPHDFKRLLPLPLTLITTVDGEGRANAAPYGCVMPILRPLDIIAIASALPRDTLKNIRETQEFVVNVVVPASFRKAMLCSKSYPPGVNELEEVGLESVPARKVKPPRVKDSLGWIEAKLEEEILRDKYSLIIGKVVCAEINEAYYSEGKLKESPIVILFPFFKKVGEKVGSREEFENIMSH